MTSVCIDLCRLIIKEFYGLVVSRVFEYIARHEPLPLRLLISRGKFSKKEAKQSLWVLLQHDFAEIVYHKPHVLLYKINFQNILQRSRVLRYIYLAQCLFGDEGKVLIQEFLKHGKGEINRIVEQASARLADPDAGKKLLIDKFSQLNQAGFVIQYIPENMESKETTHESNKTEPVVKIKNTPLKRKMVIESDEEDEEVALKKPKMEPEVTLGISVSALWKLNFDKFSEYQRHQVIINAIALRIDKRASDVAKVILKLADLPQTKVNSTKERTGGVTYNEILTYLKKQTNVTSASLDQILRVLVQDSVSFVVKDGDSGGGVYKVDIEKAFTELCIAHVNSIVQERYGSKSLRIYRLIMMKKMLDQKQIEDMVMMDVKDTRDYLFKLLEDGFLSLPEVSRTTDYVPMKTMYFFTIDLTRVAKMLVEQCYQTLSNLIVRREYEEQANKRVVDKQKRLEAILAQIEDEDDEQKQELEDQMTPSEKIQVSKHMKSLDIIEEAELQLDETIFVLETYLSFR